MGIRRFIRKLFHCKPKYNGTPVAFYRKGENGEWIKISDIEPMRIDMNEYKIVDKKGREMEMHTVTLTMNFTPIEETNKEGQK